MDAPDPHSTLAQRPTVLAALHTRARGSKARIVLPESEDERVLRAAVEAYRADLCMPMLVGEAERTAQLAAELSLDLTGIRILDPASDPEMPLLAERFEQSLAARGVKAAQPQQLAHNPLYYADLLVQHGRADGAVMGAVATTAETLRAGLRVLGVDPRYRVVTSCFLMALPDGRNLIYADCGVVPQPDAEQLADIARQSASACRRLLGQEPRVALLAFATKGSAEHPALSTVRQAVQCLEQEPPDFAFDGELQADAALVPAVAVRKAPQSEIGGLANVLIFPDLNSGNIAYKLTERLAGARAIGPLLLGLGGPVQDLSRGCTAHDIVDAMAITALEVAERRHI